MKKLFAVVCATILLCSTLCSCNRQLIDFNYCFDEAIILHADGEEERVKVKSWCDYGDSDMVQIVLENGTVYLTHSSNIILISSAKRG